MGIAIHIAIAMPEYINLARLPIKNFPIPVFQLITKIIIAIIIPMNKTPPTKNFNSYITSIDIIPQNISHY